MRLGRRSSNVQDRRGMGVPLAAGGGIGAVVIALLVIFLGGDPSEVLQTAGSETPASAPSPDDPQAVFVSQVLAETEDSWREIFRSQVGREYEDPQLVLFTDLVESECGMGQAATGPFYCPLDGKIYLDLSFFRELEERFGAPGDFARAYVVAHEVGHHVQTLLGITQQVHAARSQASQAEGNRLSVRQELQADCLAGAWAHHANRERAILEEGDVEEGLAAAAAIGDDRIQRETRGTIAPESFTHGTSAQRLEWFRRGLRSGSVEQCDTFR
ncbi:MAG TPA: neutral zinc metallopeptidase [Thermoanaerobaculia bacterium]|nr:neutral zinc metallopeptidase [Thermoanaerobaculia bacterium]